MQWSKPLQDVQILGAIGDEWHGMYRGCYFGDFTRFAVLDIDQGSRYHTQQHLKELTIALTEVGLTVTPYQSSNSSGWHLYLFLDNWEPKNELEQTLKSWLRSKKYEIKSGTLEVFPSGNALRLPLQRGFGWLTEDGIVRKRREDLTRDEAISLFLSNLEEGKADWKRAKVLINRQIAGLSLNAQEHQERLDTKGFGGLFQRGIDWDKYQRGRKYWTEGLSAFSQRTDAILCMGHYLWFGDDSIGLKPMPHSRKAAQRADWIKRVGVPMVDVWENPIHLNRAEKQLATNVGGGLVDYAAMTTAGFAGGSMAFKFTPELMPKAPFFDPKPSLSLNEKPYEFARPETLSTRNETEIKPDVATLYEKSFPKEERQPTSEVADLVKNGRILIHTTRDQDGALSTFSFVSLHDETATKFAGLDFIATENNGRSSGAGSLHLRRVVEDLKTNQPSLTAMTLEMEHPSEPGLSVAESALRARRSKFYDRLDAPDTNFGV